MASVMKRGKSYSVIWRDANGRQRWKSFKRRKEADAYRDQVGHETRRGIVVDDKKTFDALADAFEKAHKPHVKATTWRNYGRIIRLHLRPYFRDHKLPAITVADVEAFVAHCTEHDVGVPTINNGLILLGSMFRYAERHNWMHRNPAQHVKKLKERETDVRDDVDAVILTPAEFRLVLENTESPFWRLIIKTAGLTGLRQGEILGLRWKYVDLHKAEVKVREQVTDRRWSTLKSKHSRRTVPLPAELVRDLREHKVASLYKKPEDVVFANSKGNPQSRSKLTDQGWRPALRRAGLRARKFHSLRHTFVSALIRSNTNMKVIQRLCGHASITITMDVYGHLLPDSTASVAEAVAGTMLGGER